MPPSMMMEFSKLGRTELDVGKVGLGTEYLIDLPRETVVNVIQSAVRQGVNYFDLFFAQPKFRDNMGAAFKGYRDNVILAAHLGSSDNNGQYEKTRDPKVCEHFFHDFLTRYETEYVDIVFLHNIDPQEDYDDVMSSVGLLEMAIRLQKEGKARFIGFSGHNTTTSLQAVKSGQIDVLMFPVNLASHAMPGRNELLEACGVEQVGLVAMKPYAGGNLLSEESLIKVADMQMGRKQTPGARMRFTKSAKITPAQCLSYALDQKGVSTVVPGCANMEHLEAALGYLNAAEQEKEYSVLLPDFAEYKTGQCVYCNHCLPCPAEIDIGLTLRLSHKAKRDLTPELRAEYNEMAATASDCIQCGDCMERCPFGADVISHMERALEMFE